MNSFNPFVLQRVSEADIKSPNIPSNLSEHYAQCGEDILMLSLALCLRHAGIIAHWDQQVVIEIGANHAFGGSNSYLLESKLGTRSILVEANPDLLPDLRKARPQAQIVHTAICAEERSSVVLHRSNHHELSSLDLGFVQNWHDGQVGLASSVEVPALRMNHFLREYLPAGKHVLLLSIDLEGLDLAIIQDTDFTTFRPCMVLLEPSEHYHPGEGARMIEAMQARGYSLIGKTDVNLLFIDAALLMQLAAPSQVVETTAPVEAVDVCTEPTLPPVVTTASTGVTADAPNPLLDWPLDEAFIQRALQQVEARGVLTLDVFDNAITRRLASPVDVFAEVERRLRTRFGVAVDGWAAAREQAEMQARQRQHQLHGAEEVTFAQIYQELPALLPGFQDWPLAASTELQVERDALIAVPDILELTRRVRALGKPYAFVSDMYLPQAFLAEVLAGLGYADWDALYVSSELGATKATGRIWDTVADRYPLATIVHIGDNQHSDVDAPRQHGIATLGYQRAISEHRLGTKLSSALVPYSLWQRHVELDSQQTLAAPSEQARWQALGRGFGGTLLAVFVQWLAKRARQHKIDRLYFCARDGHLMQQAWVAAGLEQAYPEIQLHYLYLSRAALNLPNAARECSPHKLNAATLSFLSSSLGHTRLDTALQRAGLDQIPALVEEVRAAFGSLEALLAGPEDAQRFEALLQRHSAAVHALLQEKYVTCVEYFRQQGLADGGRYAIVDMGWHGSLQRSLAGLCRAAFPDALPAVGFYYGLWPAVARNRYLAGPMEACFSSGFLPAEKQSDLHQGVALLEELHSAAHGSTLGYRQDGGRIIPVLQATSPAQADNDRRVGWFQDGVLVGVRALFAGQGPVHARELDAACAHAALAALFLSPSANEVDLLGRIGHCATFDHSSLDPIIRPTAPASLEAMRRQLWHTEWVPGQMRLWWLQDHPEHRDWLRQLAPEMYPHFGARTLRQFL